MLALVCMSTASDSISIVKGATEPGAVKKHSSVKALTLKFAWVCVCVCVCVWLT